MHLNGRTGISTHDQPPAKPKLFTNGLYNLSELELLIHTSVFFFNRVGNLRGRVLIIFIFVLSNLSTAGPTG